jgi:hypothetical protein
MKFVHMEALANMHHPYRFEWELEGLFHFALAFYIDNVCLVVFRFYNFQQVD